MRMRFRLLFAAGLAWISVCPAARADQDPIVLPTAVPTIKLELGAAAGGATMAVAFYPGNGGRYYATLGGLPSQPAFVFNATGTLIQTQSPINVDCRGISYNWNTNALEVVAYNAKAGGGLFQMGLTSGGNFTGTNTNVLATLSGLFDDQTMPTYDSKRNVLYSRGSTFDVNVVNRTTGALVTTVHLDTTGLGLQVLAPGGVPILPSDAIGFDSTYSCIVTLDRTRPRVLVHRRDGSFLGASAIPAVPAITPPSSYGMGYANGQVFIFSGTGWFGYRIFNAPNATSAGVSTAANQFSLVAVSVEPADTTAVGNFGGPDTTAYRLGHYLPGKAAYAMTGFYAAEGRELSGIHPGVGYWYIAHGARPITVGGSTTPSRWVMPLLDGPGATAAFNQLGNPFDVAVPVSSLVVRRGTTEFNVVDAANTLSDQVVWTWNGSAYVSQGAGANIAPGQGFWLRRSAGAATDIVFARPGVNPEPALAIAGGTAAADPRLWSIALTVRQGDAASNALVLGAAALDRAGLDAISWPIPPAPPGSSLRLVARDVAASDLGASFQVPADHLAWNLVLSGAASPGEIALDVAASNLPPGDALRLVDDASGATVALEAGRSVTLAAFAGERRLRLEVTAPGTAALAPGAGRPFRLAYPNPFRGEVGLTFAIARAGDVAVRVFDLQGRLVRSLDRRGLAAGEHVLVWDGDDDAGRPVGNGVYLARWSTPGASGTTRLVKVD